MASRVSVSVSDHDSELVRSHPEVLGLDGVTVLARRHAAIYAAGVEALRRRRLLEERDHLYAVLAADAEFRAVGAELAGLAQRDELI